MKIVYRELEKADISKTLLFFADLAIEDVEVSFTEVVSDDEIDRWLKDDDIYIYGAFYEEKLIGVFRATRGQESRRHMALLTYAVDRNYRGNQIAKGVISYGMKRLKEEGIKLVRVYIFSDNRSSINTVLSCDFTLSGCIYQDHYSEKEQKYIDDLIFHKIL
ncbi:MAG: GNAT family N-acetyltransferase [Thermotaleaceae bacterium]